MTVKKGKVHERDVFRAAIVGVGPRLRADSMARERNRKAQGEFNWNRKEEKGNVKDP
jgi:hypothetical protein